METFTLIRTKDMSGINRCLRGTLTNRGRIVCYTMEPQYVHGKATVAGSGRAILAGEYECEWTESMKFKRMLPELKNVIGRKNIRIHMGNGVTDTDGCILVGLESTVGGTLMSSAAAVTKLSKFAPKYEKFRLVIVNGFDPEEEGEA